MKTATSLLVAVLTLAISACGEETRISTTAQEQPEPRPEDAPQEDIGVPQAGGQINVPASTAANRAKVLLNAKQRFDVSLKLGDFGPVNRGKAVILIRTATNAPQGPLAPAGGQLIGLWAMTNIGTERASVPDYYLQEVAGFACGEPCRRYLDATYGNTAYGLWHRSLQPGEARNYDGWLTNMERTMGIEPGQTEMLGLFEDTTGARSGDFLRINLRDVAWIDSDGRHTLPAPRSDWREIDYNN